MPTDRPMPSDELATIRRLAEQERVRHGVEEGDVGAHTLSLAALDLIETVERLTSERDKFKSACAEMDKAITWHTSCLRCSSLLDASYAETCRAEQAEQQRDEALVEVKRLRARVHEVASEGEKRGAMAESQLAKLRALMHEAGRRHGDEMERLGKDRGCHISGFGQATAAAIVGERDEALAEVERLRGEVTRFTIGGEDEHPELRCNRCGRQNVSWSAPSPLWNQVMRDGDINKVPELFAGIICTACFGALAEEAGIARRWRFYAEVVNVPLATVTPSGRVWNEKTWLWEEPENLAARSETSVEPCPAVSPTLGRQQLPVASVADLEHENKTLEAWVRVHRQRRAKLLQAIGFVTDDMPQLARDLAEDIRTILHSRGCETCTPGCPSCTIDTECGCYEHQAVEPSALPDTTQEG